MAHAIAGETEAPPLQLITAAQLDLTPELQPWIERYRQYCLPVLAKALAAIRSRERAPCLFIHGPSGSGKSLLATALVKECEAVCCLDCVANAYRYRSNLRLDSIVLDHCAVFVIDAIELLNGTELQRFYARCAANGTVLVLLSQAKAVPQEIGFPLPACSTVFRLSREDGLVVDDARI